MSMDIILTTNSPGEVSAWVKPMVKALHREWPDSRITVFIPPCTFASGRETPVVESFTEVNQVIGPRAYIKYAVFRRKPREFCPGKNGFVLFLGGDLGHAVLLGKRLNYPVYAYSERAAGHAKSIRLFFVPDTQVTERLHRKGIPRKLIRQVGDLMIDAINPDITAAAMREKLQLDTDNFVLNIFPGSRPYEVRETLPFFLKALLLILSERKLTPIITLAPFITLEYLQDILYKVKEFDWEIVESEHRDLFKLKLNEWIVWIYKGLSYNTMQISDLVLALPGTNNVELAVMKIPTLVVLPLNWPELIPLPGIVGIIGAIPGLGGWLKRKVVIPRILPKFKYVSPVNRHQNEEILPELIGVLTPNQVFTQVLHVMNGEIYQIKEKLQNFNKSEKVAELIIEQINTDIEQTGENND